MQLLFILPLDTISAQDKHVRKGDTSTPTLPKAYFFFLLSPQNEYNLHPQGTIQTLKSLKSSSTDPSGFTAPPTSYSYRLCSRNTGAWAQALRGFNGSVLPKILTGVRISSVP